MVTEALVKEALSSEMISAGEALTRRLDDAGFGVTASFWFYLPDANAWRLFVASPEVSTHGAKEAYKQVQSAIWQMAGDQRKISLKDVTVVESRDRLVSLLRRLIKTGPGISGVRLSGNAIDGVLIEDAYVYRLV